MESKLEVNRLEKDELIYELKFRGFTDVLTVKDMRKTLRNYLKLENSKSDLKYPEYPFSFREDIEYISRKIRDIENLITDFNDSNSSSGYFKINSKLAHVFGRTQKSNATNDDEHATRSKLLVDLLGLESKLKSKARKFMKLSQQSDMPVDLSVAMSSSRIDSDTESSGSEEIINDPVDHLSHRIFKSVNISKWNLIKFSGDNKTISLSAFLENVEELRISHGVTGKELFEAAHELFVGKALIWFRSVKNKVSDWSQLVNELRLQFQPPNFNEKLLSEIRNRTQGPNENMGMYIAVMTNMFNRLTIPVDESVRIKILMHNIAPFYQAQLGLTSINSVEQLLQLGRQLEARKDTIDSFTPPPRNKSSLMEPDLAYVYSDSMSSNSVKIDSLTVCWNCRKSGHIARKCSQPKTRYCFKCGKPNCTVKTCSSCSKSLDSGKSQRRHDLQIF